MVSFASTPTELDTQEAAVASSYEFDESQRFDDEDGFDNPNFDTDLVVKLTFNKGSEIIPENKQFLFENYQQLILDEKNSPDFWRLFTADVQTLVNQIVMNQYVGKTNIASNLRKYEASLRAELALKSSGNNTRLIDASQKRQFCADMFTSLAMESQIKFSNIVDVETLRSIALQLASA